MQIQTAVFIGDTDIFVYAPTSAYSSPDGSCPTHVRAQCHALAISLGSLGCLGFFEKLIPTTGVAGMAIRGLQAEVRHGREIHWQVLVIQALKNPSEFSGRLELSFTGVLNGKPWAATLPGGAQAFKLKQYGCLEGVFALPPQAVIKGVTAKVLAPKQPNPSMHQGAIIAGQLRPVLVASFAWVAKKNPH